MTSSPSRFCERLKRAISGRLPERYRRDDSGLTTLEWLLIVAAVAGLAALAVVLVTNVVSDTSEQISGSSARRTSAELAAADVTTRARAVTAVADSATPTSGQEKITTLKTRWKRDCERLRITYGDIDDLTVEWGKGNPSAANPAFSGAGVGPADDGEWNAPATGPWCRVT